MAVARQSADQWGSGWELVAVHHGAPARGDWREALSEAASRGTSVVVDLGQVEVLDSADLGLLLSVHRRLRDGGPGLVLRNVGTRVERVLRISGLSAQFSR